MPTATPSDVLLLVARLVAIAKRSESKKQQLEYLSKQTTKYGHVGGAGGRSFIIRRCKLRE